MAIRLTNGLTGSQENVAVIRNGGLNSTRNKSYGISGVTPTGGIPQETLFGSFTLGSGYNVTTASVVLYDDNVLGSGMLKNPLVANRGNSTCYIGTNNTTRVIANGFPLGSGESMVIEDNVRQLWAMTAAGSAVLVAHADFAYNPNAL